MVLKRHLSDRDGDVGSQEFPIQAPKRKLSFATVARDITKGLPFHEFVTKLEPFLRSVVRDEVERAILHHSSPSSSFNLCDSFKARDWQLHFDDRLPSTLFTCNNIESVDNKPVKIVIIDASSKKIMASGPLSSIKVEIVVLDGDFGDHDLEDWTEEEFNANIVREREGKRPLVTGELVVPLRDGVGYILNISFTDNSSWIRSRQFRLGARIVQNISSCKARIREARSEAFVVKDHRGESYKKHHPPSLGDEIWRLERIGKEGAFHKRLADKGITTVKDFLCSYYVDPSSLRNILGGGISNRSWDTIVKHATDCILDDTLYYRDVEGVRLVFNSVLKVVGVSFDGQNYKSPDKLNETQMGLVENLKRDVYKKLGHSAALDEVSGFGPSMLSSSLLADPFSSSSLSLQHNFPGVHPDQQEMQMASSHIKTSMPYNYDVQDGSHHYPTQVFTPTWNSLMKMDSWAGPYDGGDGWAPIGSSLGLLMHNSQVGTSTWQRNELLFAPSNEELGVVSSNFGKHKAWWCMIRAVVKWGISVRRYVAAKKWQDLFT